MDTPIVKRRAPAPIRDLNMHVFDQDTFFQAFEKDLRAAKGLVLIQSAYATPRGIDRYLKTFSELTRRNVRLCLFMQQPRELTPRLEHDHGYVRQKVEAIGGHVTFRTRKHEKLAVIDGQILWDGSLNMLSHFDTDERMTRHLNDELAAAAIERHRLDACISCTERDGFYAGTRPFQGMEMPLLGLRLAERRMSLHLSQRQLAEKAGLYQRLVSEVECGKRDERMGFMSSLCHHLRLEVLVVPRFLVPSVKDFVDSRCNQSWWLHKKLTEEPDKIR